MVTGKELKQMDPKYFKHAGDHTEEEAIHYLATWLFDENDNETACRKKIKEICPDIYVRVLEAFIDGEHDT